LFLRHNDYFNSGLCGYLMEGSGILPTK